jgi:hypothetical protein
MPPLSGAAAPSCRSVFSEGREDITATALYCGFDQPRWRTSIRTRMFPMLCRNGGFKLRGHDIDVGMQINCRKRR